MFSSRCFATVLLLTICFVYSLSAQVVVNSTFMPKGAAYYGDAQNWSPPEVPNNSPQKNYNVTIPAFVRMNVDATISNLTLSGSYLAQDHSLSVTGSTTLTDFSLNIASSTAGGATLAAGSMSSFSAGSLTAIYYLSNYNTSAGLATLQFNGANVMTLSHANLVLAGP